MAQTAEDCAILLNAMASFDERDSTSLERDKEDYTRDLDKPLKGLKIGLPKEYFGEGADADVQTALQSVIDLLKAQGAETVEVSLPQTSLSIPAYYVLASAEASTNLSRFAAYVMAIVRRNSVIWKKCTATPVPKVSAARLSAVS